MGWGGGELFIFLLGGGTPAKNPGEYYLNIPVYAYKSQNSKTHIPNVIGKKCLYWFPAKLWNTIFMMYAWMG